MQTPYEQQLYCCSLRAAVASLSEPPIKTHTGAPSHVSAGRHSSRSVQRAAPSATHQTTGAVRPLQSRPAALQRASSLPSNSCPPFRPRLLCRRLPTARHTRLAADHTHCFIATALSRAPVKRRQTSRHTQTHRASATRRALRGIATPVALRRPSRGWLEEATHSAIMFIPLGGVGGSRGASAGGSPLKTLLCRRPVGGAPARQQHRRGCFPRFLRRGSAVPIQ